MKCHWVACDLMYPPRWVVHSYVKCPLPEWFSLELALPTLRGDHFGTQLRYVKME